MGKNIKINNSEPCLCGSGKKFKDCCKAKMFTSTTRYSEDILNNPQRVNAILQKMMDKTDFKICVYPDKSCCKLPIKNAHTLQNNGVLSAVSELEHVMVTDPLNKVRKGYITRKISKNKATTFYGFCEYHDSYLFKDIELKEYKNEIKQNFLFAYRVLAQEYHKKERVISSLQNCVKENSSILVSPIMVENYRMMDLARKDIRELLDIFNTSYINENFDILYNYVYKFEQQCRFAVTTMYVPASTLDGEELIDIYSKEKDRLPSVFLTVIPGNDCSYLVMSCLKLDYAKIKKYFDDIEELDENKLKRFLNWTLPTYSENIVLSPKLWEAWSEKAKNQYERIVSGMGGDFEKMLNREFPFETYKDIEVALNVQFGIIDMNNVPQYDLFLQE